MRPFPEATGHFTQVVWKVGLQQSDSDFILQATTEIGCWIAECQAGTLFDASYGVSGTSPKKQPLAQIVDVGKLPSDMRVQSSCKWCLRVLVTWLMKHLLGKLY